MNLLLTLVTCHIYILAIINIISRNVSLLGRVVPGTPAMLFVALLYSP
jgi:hypothetical protein